MCIAERGGGLLWLIPRWNKYIQNLASHSDRFSARCPAVLDWRVYLLTTHSDWLSAWLTADTKNFRQYIIFWPLHFPSGLIHFLCPLFTVKHRNDILFWNLQRTFCQRLICNTFRTVSMWYCRATNFYLICDGSDVYLVL